MLLSRDHVAPKYYISKFMLSLPNFDTSNFIIAHLQYLLCKIMQHLEICATRVQQNMQSRNLHSRRVKSSNSNQDLNNH